ncbi:MAG: hypothetical protein Tp152SUR00d2C52646391_82 [Prokaryotic dsDNA virus sp.]|nr:MAG: hypothetical protein Tp152SUR00d2C52646391_82 [Prokaryotic dsDNA virus sp.]|tara:strand:- start:5635 stop:5817 length:183 start_codon:yes stop_codon:yes gene_type:complete
MDSQKLEAEIIVLKAKLYDLTQRKELLENTIHQLLQVSGKETTVELFEHLKPKEVEKPEK